MAINKDDDYFIRFDMEIARVDEAALADDSITSDTPMVTSTYRHCIKNDEFVSSEAEIGAFVDKLESAREDINEFLSTFMQNCERKNESTVETYGKRLRRCSERKATERTTTDEQDAQGTD
ncbi:hypothetical protein ACOME3_002299 [Neoechinorhynchus agilis]